MALTEEEQRLLQDSLQRFITDSHGDSHRRSFAAEPSGFSSDNWRRFSDFGWVGIGIDADYGGTGGSVRDVCIVMNYVGRALMVEPFLESAVVGAWLIEHSGAASLKAEWLP